MGILAECPICRRKQSLKNKKCKCGANLDKEKKKRKVRFWIDYPLPNGKVRREAVVSFEGLNACSIEDAQDALAKRKVQRREKRIFDMLPGTDLTFNELSDWYLDDPAIKKLRSYKGIVSNLKVFNKVFGSRIVNSIVKRDLEKYQHKRKSQGIKPRTIDKIIGQGQTIVEQGFLNRKIDGEALRVFKSVKKLLVKGTNARKRTVSIEEYFNLINVAADHTKDMMVVAYNTGMRPGEVRTLRWSYVDWKAGFIKLPPEVTKEGAKTEETKWIPINHNVKAILDKRRPSPGIVSEDHHDHVFTYRGKPLTGKQGSRKSFSTACKNAGLVYGEKEPGGVIFHDFRRSVKTNMLAAGVKKEYRDTILGHSLKGMDRHYIVPSKDDLKKAMDQYTEWLDNKIKAVWINLDHFLDQTAKKSTPPNVSP